MRCLFYRLVKHKYHCGENCYAGDNAAYNALGHYDTEVKSERKAHEAHCKEACNSCCRAADYGRYRCRDSVCHCLVVVIGIILKLFLVAVVEEYRIVHRYTKLEDKCERLCDEAYLAHHEVSTEVPYYRKTYAEHEEHGNEETVHCKYEDNTYENYCDDRVYDRLAVREVFHICGYRRHTADEALLRGDVSHFVDSLKCYISRGRIIKEDCHHRCVALVEHIVDLLWKNFLRYIEVCERLVADDL